MKQNYVYCKMESKIESYINKSVTMLPCGGLTKVPALAPDNLFYVLSLKNRRQSINSTSDKSF